MPADPWIQYGCFGLLAALVVWALRWGIPGALATHKETVAGIVAAHQAALGALVETFNAEGAACRAERRETAAATAAEREVERQVRHEFADKLNAALTRVEVAVTRARATDDQ